MLCETFIKSYTNLVEWSLDKINDEIAYALLEKMCRMGYKFDKYDAQRMVKKMDL